MRPQRGSRTGSTTGDQKVRPFVPVAKMARASSAMADAIRSATAGSQEEPMATLLGKDDGPRMPTEGFAPESTPCSASLQTL